MDTSLNQRSPVAKAGWLIGLFIFGWLAFLFIPWPERTPPREPMPKMIAKPPSKLQAVGLADNPDWEGMPELFRIWANEAKWENEKTQFAFWNPGSNSYSYFFEATREGYVIRFRSISEAEVLKGKEFIDDEDGAFVDADSGDPKKPLDLRSDSPTHPFVFFWRLEMPKMTVPISRGWPGTGAGADSDAPAPPAVEKPAPLQLPSFQIKNPSVPDDQNKK